MNEKYEIGFVLLKNNSKLGYSIFTQNGQFYICEDAENGKKMIKKLLENNAEVFEDIKQLLKKYPPMKCIRQTLLTAPKNVQIVRFTVDWDFHDENAAFTKQTAETLLRISIANFVGSRGHNIFKSPEWDTISSIVVIGIDNIPEEGYDISLFNLSRIPNNKEGFYVS